MGDNKETAAIAAVLGYIENDWVSAAEVASAAATAEAHRLPAAGGGEVNPWALYGRQRIMNMRAAMQARAHNRRV
jgi:hypothetical protein